MIVMKKIFCIIVLFISVAISASAQKTVGEIREGFQNGVFYLMDKEFYIMFQSVDKEWGSDGKIRGAVFETVADSESMEKGEKWFKEKMKDEQGREVMCTLFFDKFKIVMDEDYTVTENGRARITMTLIE